MNLTKYQSVNFLSKFLTALLIICTAITIMIVIIATSYFGDNNTTVFIIAAVIIILIWIITPIGFDKLAKWILTH